MSEIGKIKNEAFQKIRKINNPKELEEVRVFYLGRKGVITMELKALKDKDLEEKRQLGPKLNALRQELEIMIREQAEQFKNQVKGDDFDLTRPGERRRTGSLHVLTKTENRIVEIFKNLNFSVAEGPEAESEYYNFDALNIPANHPAREMWDTFWIKNPKNHKPQITNHKQNSNSKDLDYRRGERLLMRTHTSPVQARFMENVKPPFQIVVPGRVFRYEATDMSHEINFHQIEGLMVGRTVNLANLKFVVEEFLNRFFGKRLEFRFRPSYFPFTEPSVEVDIKMPGGDKWLEVMGAGMVHEKVLRGVKIDPEEWQGFAFGMGVERLAMLKYKIPDIRMFYSGDLRFIRQF